jgi:hypothetical protein
MCAEIELLKVKVPLICLGTEVSRHAGREVTSPQADKNDSRFGVRSKIAQNIAWLTIVNPFEFPVGQDYIEI